MANCWLPSVPPDQSWTDIPPTPPSEVFTDSAIACIAIACYAVACMPKPDPDWIDDGAGPVYVCGEWPVYTPPSGGGGGSEPVITSGFSNGFSRGFG